MAIEIKEVRTRRELRTFVNFPEKLYKDNPYYVPPLVFDQMDTLDQKKGAAQEFCDSKLYLAYKDGKLAGRVAAIVNRLANHVNNTTQQRRTDRNLNRMPRIDNLLSANQTVR